MRERACRWKISRMTMVRSITSPPTSFSRLNDCEGEISWSMRITSAACSSRSRRSSSRLPVPKYAALSNPARFCVNVPTTSNPSVFPSRRSSASEASNSRSLTLDNCTAATMARFDFWATSCVMVHGAYQQSQSGRLHGLQPAAHGRLIAQVLRTESPFEVFLFSPYDEVVHERRRRDERRQQPHAVEPHRDTQLEQGERQIDRVPAEAIRPGPDD